MSNNGSLSDEEGNNSSGNDWYSWAHTLHPTQNLEMLTGMDLTDCEDMEIVVKILRLYRRLEAEGSEVTEEEAAMMQDYCSSYMMNFEYRVRELIWEHFNEMLARRELDDWQKGLFATEEEFSTLKNYPPQEEIDVWEKLTEKILEKVHI